LFRFFVMNILNRSINFSDVFGTGGSWAGISIKANDGDIFRENILKKIQKIDNEVAAWEETYRALTFSIGSRSAKTVKVLSGGEINIDPLMWPDVPKSIEEINRLKHDIFSDAAIGHIVSADGRSTLIQTEFKSNISYEESFKLLQELAKKYSDDETTVEIGGFPTLMGWIVTEETHILYTENGGKTWQVQFNDEEYILKAVSFTDANNGWAVGEYGYIYHTNNGGKTWKKQGGYFDINEDTGELEGGTSLFDVIAIDSQKAWAVGLDGKVIKTVDRGKTWEELKTGFPTTPIFAITWDKADTIVIAGKEACLYSKDKGQSWEKALFDPKIDYSWIYDLTPVSSKGFVAAGENGAIYHSKTPELWQRVQY